MLTSLTHTNTHFQCLSASYCNDLKAISFVGFYWASVCLSLCLLADTHKHTHTHTDRALGSMGWLCLRPNVNQTTTDKHMLAWAHTRTHIICLFVWLLWTERPQLFSFQTKETIWFNIKHMLGYLMALCSDYKRGREGGRGAMVGQEEGWMEGAWREKKISLMELLEFYQIFPHIKEGNEISEMAEMQGKSQDGCLCFVVSSDSKRASRFKRRDKGDETG